MVYSNFPKGFRDGVTILDLPHQPLVNPANKVLWVDSGADRNGDGSYHVPYATVAAAISAASAGDTIMIAAGHTENLSSATIFAVATASLTFIGMGEGQRIPKFTTTATAGALMVTAANCVFQNLRFVAGIDNTVQAIDLSADADGTIIRRCIFEDTASNKEFLKHIDIATTIANVIIEDCEFICTAGGGMTSSIFFTGSSSDVVIRNNFFWVDASASVIDHLTGIATNILIHDNRMVNLDATTVLGLGIKSDSTSTGQVFDNYIFCSEAASAIFAVTNDFFVCENYSTNNINASGVLQPAADTI
ncbi:MAG: hypothetical protein C4542_08140 [Dehalococcoidia bacterium]|nr:MAG: hypothetical protein C4542_08140 [Dehalococcoidia bacterium]